MSILVIYIVMRFYYKDLRIKCKMSILIIYFVKRFYQRSILLLCFPAPNTYKLPPLVGDKSIEGDKKRAPAFSLKGRSKIGGFDEDLSKVGESVEANKENLIFI